jgi:TrmH family RNA methyltransferase
VSVGSWTLERILALRGREAREEAQSYWVEGVRFVVAAADAGAPFRAVVVAPRILNSPLGQMLARRLRARGVETLRLSPEEFARVSLLGCPQGIGAVLALPHDSLRSIRPGEEDCWLWLGPVRNAGNLGTLMRTCVASGATGLIVSPLGEADPFHPTAVRASMGALSSLRIVRADASEVREWKRRHGVRLFAAQPRWGSDFRSVHYRGPVALVLGSERTGLTAAQRALCDAQVSIPMHAGDSLNLAVAGSVLLYEVWRQRRHH